MKLQEEAREIYDNVEFSAGLILHDPEEEVYLKIEAEGREPEELHMQRHEALAIIWVVARALMASEIAATGQSKNGR